MVFCFVYSQCGEAVNGLIVIEQDIREDYRQGRLVNLSGWHLSRTEARIYALASLQGP